jgi:N-acetylmuramoyl-L-alanine amidase
MIESMQKRKSMRIKLFLLILLVFTTGCAHKSSKRVNVREAQIKRKQQVAFHEALRKNRGKFTIMIDAGHGGDDFGCHSVNAPKLYEKQLSLTLAQMVNRYLKHQGYRTELTRQDDTFVPLKTRAQLANDKKATLFVSLHFNSAPSKKADGIEVFYYKSEQTPKRSDRSQKLADLVLEQLLSHTHAKSRGVKHGNFAVIRETKMPAILVEAGFLTNEQEMNKIREVSYLQNISLAVAKGVHEFLNENGSVLVAQ